MDRIRYKYQLSQGKTLSGIAYDQYSQLSNASMGNPLLMKMVDYSGPLKGGEEWPMRPCTISRFSRVATSGPYRYYRQGNPNYWIEIVNSACWAPFQRHLIQPDLPSVAGLISQTLDELSGAMPDDQRVNIVENLLDMASVKGLVSSLTGVVAGLGKTFGGIMSYSLAQIRRNMIKDRVSEQRALKNIAVGSSETWLSYWLVAKPLISDVRNLYNMVSNIQGRLNELAFRNSKPYFSIKCRASGSTSGLLENTGGGSSYSSVRTVGYTSYWNAKYDVSDAAATLLALQSIGFATPLSTAWNCIPLSFVVDYIADINSKLLEYDKIVSESAKKLMIGNATFVSACCTDFTRTTHSNWIRLPGTGVVYGVGTSWAEQFSRSPLYSATFLDEPTLNNAGLTKKRLTTMGALTVCRKLR